MADSGMDVPYSPGTSLSSSLSLHKLLCVFLQSMWRYVTHAGRTTWVLVVQSTAAAQLLLSQPRHPPREWVRLSLPSQTFRDFHHLDCDLRLDNGRDLFRYLRMTRQKYVPQSLPDYYTISSVFKNPSITGPEIAAGIYHFRNSWFQSFQHENMFAFYELTTDRGRFSNEQPVSALVVSTNVHCQDLSN